MHTRFKLSNMIKAAAVALSIGIPVLAGSISLPYPPSPSSPNLESRVKRMVIIDPGHAETGDGLTPSGEATAARMLAERLQWYLDNDDRFETFLTRTQEGYHPHVIRFVEHETNRIDEARKVYESNLDSRSRANHTLAYRRLLFARALISNPEWDASLAHPLSFNANILVSLHYNESGRALKQKNGVFYEPAHGFCIYAPLNNSATRCLHSSASHAMDRISQSYLLAKELKEALLSAKREASTIKHESSGIEYQEFAVLSASCSASVLIEVGFIKNPKDRKNAFDPQWIDQTAQAVYNGIVSYRENEILKQGSLASRY